MDIVLNICICLSLCVTSARAAALRDDELEAKLVPLGSDCEMCGGYEINASELPASVSSRLWASLLPVEITDDTPVDWHNAVKVHVQEIPQQVSNKRASLVTFTANVPTLLLPKGEAMNVDNSQVPGFKVSLSLFGDKTQYKEIQLLPRPTPQYNQPSFEIIDDGEEEYPEYYSKALSNYAAPSFEIIDYGEFDEDEENFEYISHIKYKNRLPIYGAPSFEILDDDSEEDEENFKDILNEKFNYNVLSFEILDLDDVSEEDE